jgi:CHAD domain-containing protein
MAWRFEAGEPLADAFRRVAAEEIASIAVALQASDEDPPAAVHATRRGLKRLRALLRLARPTLGPAYDRENRRWRDAGRSLAALRDGTVLQAAFDRLVESFDGKLPAEHVASMRGRLRDDSGTDAADAGPRRKRILRALANAGQRLAMLPWPVTSDGLHRGLMMSQKKLRESWKAVKDDPQPEVLHRWRKRVKDQATQLRLLRDLLPDEIRERRVAEKTTAELLGDDHDLWLLAERLSGASIPIGAEPSRDLLLVALEKRRRALRHKAIKVGEAASADKPQAFAKAVMASWRATAPRPRSGGAPATGRKPISRSR